MFVKLKKLFWATDEHPILQASENKKASFVLLLGTQKIGELEHVSGKWIFKYSDEFKNELPSSFITDFPDVNKKYESQDLWPFFVSRIPSVNQPVVQERLVKEKKQESDIDEIDMLRWFGYRTISNPFLLETRS